MPWIICIPVPKDSTTIDGKRRICFVIPTHVILDPRPHPEPFVTHPNFDPSKVRHLQALAAIDSIAEQLPAELSQEIQKSVATNMASLGKGFGVGIELSRQTEKAY